MAKKLADVLLERDVRLAERFSDLFNQGDEDFGQLRIQQFKGVKIWQQ